MKFRSEKQSYELRADARDHERRAIGFSALGGMLAAISHTNLIQEAAQQGNLLKAAFGGIGFSFLNMALGNDRTAARSAALAGGLGALVPHTELVQHVVQDDNLRTAAEVSLAAAGVSGVMALVRGIQGEVSFREDMKMIQADRQLPSDEAANKYTGEV